MGMIKGPTHVTQDLINQIAAEVRGKGNNKGDAVRAKLGKYGIEIKIGDAKGNYRSRDVQVISKDINNKAVAAAVIKQYAREGTTGNQVRQEVIDKAIHDRDVVTIDQALPLLQQGRMIDSLRALPPQNLEKLAATLPAYCKAGAVGVDILKEHLQNLNLQQTTDPTALKTLAQMLSNPQLKTEATADIRQVLTDELKSVGQQLTKQGHISLLLTLLDNCQDLEAVSGLKASLTSLAKAQRKDSPVLQAYNRIGQRQAELTGITEAAKELARGNPAARQSVVTTLNQTTFSGRAETNQKLKEIALASAQAHLDAHGPKQAWPDISPIAEFYQESAKVPDPAAFQQAFAQGLETLVKDGQLSVEDLNFLIKDIEIYGGPRASWPALDQLTATYLETHAAKLELPDISTIAAHYHGENGTSADPAAFQQGFTQGVESLVKAGKLSVEDLNFIIRDIDTYGGPRASWPALDQLTTTLAPPPANDLKAINHTRFRALNQLSQGLHKREELLTPENARFTEIKSPKATNVPVWSVNKQTGQMANQIGKIHANTMPFAGKASAIATQYPKANDESKGMFWRMAQQQGTNLIVDLTQKADKLQPYYPEQLNTPVTYDDMKVTFRGTDKTGYRQYDIEDTKTGQTTQTKRYHYTGWKDHEGTEVKDLKALAGILNNSDFPGVTVHCRAGVGRTSVAYAAAMLRNQVQAGAITKENMQDKVDALIMDLRQARGRYAVQTEPQRLLLTELVDDWLTHGVK